MNLRRFSKDHSLTAFALTAVLAGGCSATPPAALVARRVESLAPPA